MNDQVYLRQNVIAEPLFNQWYAWSYLIPPATAAMYIANWHLKLMQSFISAPQVHASALKNPEMLGGPFINYPASRVKDVRALMERTRDEQAHMLRFAEAVQDLDKILAAEAAGFSLEPLYAKVPEPLRGYVELVYDLNNNPSFRFIEGLLYKSPYYNPSSQSLLLSLVEKDERSFILSTPRLEDAGGVHLRLPFNHEGLDELFRMKSSPGSYRRVKEALGVREQDDALFSTFFTEEPPRPAPRHDGGATRVRYFGHACVLVETREASVLVDPLISYKYDCGTPHYDYEDLPERIDYVLLTHNHQDHVMFETLLQLRHRIGRVVVPKSSGASLADPSLKLILRQVGFRDVYEIDEMETVEAGGLRITGLPFFGEHGDLNIRAKMAYLIRTPDSSVMCVADSNNIEPRLYELLSEEVGEVDVLFIGMECEGAPLSWLYGPLMTRPLSRKMDQTRRFDGSDCDKATRIVDQLKPKQVYVYAMGQEPWLTFITSISYTEQSRPIVESNRLVAECARRGLPAERLYCQKEIRLGSG